jgi:hypothetical protein
MIYIYIKFEMSHVIVLLKEQFKKMVMISCIVSQIQRRFKFSAARCGLQRESNSSLRSTADNENHCPEQRNPPLQSNSFRA